MGHVVVFRDNKCVFKKRLAVAPITKLDCSADPGPGADNYGGSRSEDLSFGTTQNDILYTPRQHNKNADYREVHIAVCMSLCSYLDQTNDRNQRSQIPAPARNKVWKT